MIEKLEITRFKSTEEVKNVTVIPLAAWAERCSRLSLSTADTPEQNVI